MSKNDRFAIQQEIQQRLTEIDRINATTTFGDRTLFNFGQGALVDVPVGNIGTCGAYSGGYNAMHYINDTIGEKGIQRLMSELAQGETFDNAIKTASSGHWPMKMLFYRTNQRHHLGRLCHQQYGSD